MVYALMCEDSAAGGHETRTAVDGVLDEWAGKLTAPVGGAETAPGRPGPDPETWGLLPHQVAQAEAADRLADVG